METGACSDGTTGALRCDRHPPPGRGSVGCGDTSGASAGARGESMVHRPGRRCHSSSDPAVPLSPFAPSGHLPRCHRGEEESPHCLSRGSGGKEAPSGPPGHLPRCGGGEIQPAQQAAEGLSDSPSIPARGRAPSAPSGCSLPPRWEGAEGKGFLSVGVAGARNPSCPWGPSPPPPRGEEHVRIASPTAVGREAPFVPSGHLPRCHRGEEESPHCLSRGSGGGAPGWARRGGGEQDSPLPLRGISPLPPGRETAGGSRPRRGEHDPLGLGLRPHPSFPLSPGR
jgi:hypothetical protein